MQLNGTPPPSVSLWDLSPWSSLQSCVSLGTGPEFHHMLETLSAHLTPHTDPPEGLPSSVESSGITSVHPALHVGSLGRPSRQPPRASYFLPEDASREPQWERTSQAGEQGILASRCPLRPWVSSSISGPGLPTLGSWTPLWLPQPPAGVRACETSQTCAEGVRISSRKSLRSMLTSVPSPPPQPVVCPSPKSALILLLLC